MKKIKKYYRIEFELTSPLSVGCGEDNVTDSDIVRDSRGCPYIPGTALAGQYRRLFTKETADKYFGQELTQKRKELSSQSGKNELTDSDIVTYDAAVTGAEKQIISKRDMVALDEYKTAEKGAKFDFQVLEPGVSFVTYIEQNMDSTDEQYVIDEIAHAWLNGEIRLGAKTGRGYGHTKAVKAESALFDLNDKEDDSRKGENGVESEKTDRDKWLAFDMYYDKDKDKSPEWKPVEKPVCLSTLSTEDSQYEKTLSAYNNNKIRLAGTDKLEISFELKLQGGISVRQYFSDVGEADYMQLTEKGRTSGDENESAEGIPVIPGTSWAGAFRAQMAKLDPDFRKKARRAELFFGNAKAKDTESHRSRVEFSESRLRNGRWVVYTRNAIDRFTGGTVDGALYTEKTYYDGDTELTISCDFTGMEKHDKDNSSRNAFAQALSAAIMDLHSGYMAVGGLTAVGRGLFEVKKITVDGKAFTKEFIPGEGNIEEIYGELCQAIAGKGEQA